MSRKARPGPSAPPPSPQRVVRPVLYTGLVADNEHGGGIGFVHLGVELLVIGARSGGHDLHVHAGLFLVQLRHVLEHFISYECYGIIVNPDLVEKAGHSMDEIKNFDGLKAVVEDIHANAATLGFDAFTSCDMDGSSSWRFTAVTTFTSTPVFSLYSFATFWSTSSDSGLKFSQ